MIEIEGVAKRFGEVRVLDGVDFAVEPGRVLGARYRRRER